jgi:glycosyltransferase involved in cell wall biosynthesis
MFEAMASGRPVVVSARGEAAELVRAHAAGLVVRPEDPRALAGALLALARQPGLVAALGSAARRCAEAYDWNAIADRWVQLLTEATGGPLERRYEKGHVDPSRRETI